MTTPRTDRAEHFGLTSGECVLVHEDDMKKLELELAQLEQDHATTLRLHHEDKKKLETELIALQEKYDKHKECDTHYEELLIEADKVEKERDQLLATVEGLREALQNSDALNRNMVEAAELETLQYFSEYKRTLEGTKLALQSSVPPTNLVKRSVLEKCYNALFGFREFSGDDAAFPLLQCEEALKEAHEELQRTAK